MGIFSKKTTATGCPMLREWKQLALFGFLNTTVYLGLFVYAMKYTAAGIGSLATSTNPLLIVLLSSWLIGRKPAKAEIFSILISMTGIGIATYPLLKNSSSSFLGVVILMLSMVSVSFCQCILCPGQMDIAQYPHQWLAGSPRRSILAPFHLCFQ
jgi:drug/metabolite transporter (DMT)-like permease